MYTIDALSRAASGERTPRCVEQWSLDEAPYVAVSDCAGWVRLRFRTSAGDVRSAAIEPGAARRLAMALLEAADQAERE